MEVEAVLAEAQGLFQTGHYRACAALLQKLSCTVPSHTAIWRALGLAHYRLGETKQALRNYQHALELDPDDAETHFSLALLYLTEGNFARGLPEYEWRVRRPGCVAAGYAQGAAYWDGRSLATESLLVHCEQGFGDAIQFIRFLPQVRRRVARIFLACHPELVRLFTGLDGLTGIITEGDVVPRCDFHCPLLSLPKIFGLTRETIPAAVPYLTVRSALPPKGEAESWRVGLVWRARQHDANGAYKSLTLENLSPLADLPVTWFNLQKDADEEERDWLARHLSAHSVAQNFRDFQDTAEFVQSLDLVVTVDTATAHLAGALGRPTWVLLPRWADWRWLQPERSDSPWYPTMTLFRQRQDRDWPEVVQRVRARLELLVRSGQRAENRPA